MNHTEPGTEPRAFREALSRLGAAVHIVTTDGKAGRYGLTASAVCSVSDTPPTILVCVNRSARAHDSLLENGVLCVNLLAGRHEALCNLFARSGLAAEHKFGGADWEVLRTGAPALVDAVANLDCEIADVKQVGTHSVIFCRVQKIVLAPSSESLIYFDRQYHHLGLASTDRP